MVYQEPVYWRVMSCLPRFRPSSKGWTDEPFPVIHPAPDTHTHRHMSLPPTALQDKGPRPPLNPHMLSAQAHYNHHLEAGEANQLCYRSAHWRKRGPSPRRAQLQGMEGVTCHHSQPYLITLDARWTINFHHSLPSRWQYFPYTTHSFRAGQLPPTRYKKK